MANSRYGVDRRRVFEMTDSIAMPRRHHLRRTGPARPHLADLVIPIEDHRDLVWLLQHQQTHMLENERDRFRPTLVGRFRKHDAGQRDLALASSQPPLPMGGRLDSCNPRPAGRNCSPRSFVTGSSPDPDPTPVVRTKEGQRNANYRRSPERLLLRVVCRDRGQSPVTAFALPQA
jgi:hypothetical protein